MFKINITVAFFYILLMFRTSLWQWSPLFTFTLMLLMCCDVSVEIYTDTCIAHLWGEPSLMWLAWSLLPEAWTQWATGAQWCLGKETRKSTWAYICNTVHQFSVSGVTNSHCFLTGVVILRCLHLVYLFLSLLPKDIFSPESAGSKKTSKASPEINTQGISRLSP